MSSLHTLVCRSRTGDSVAWRPTTLDRLGKSELYLEAVLVESPSLLDPGDEQVWHEMVRRWFPEDDNSDELADVLLARLKRGEINLIIACDKVPPGTDTMIASIASQRALGFELGLVETVPFVREGELDGDIMFASSTWLETSIVARTAVTVTYRQGDAQPSTTVLATSMEEVQDAVQEETRGRVWTVEEVAQVVGDMADPTVTALFDFARAESANGKCVPTGRRISPIFVLLLEGFGEDELPHKRVVYGFIKEWGPNLTLYLEAAKSLLTAEACEEYHRKLIGLFGTDMSRDTTTPVIPLTVLRDRLTDFLDLMRWLKSLVRPQTRFPSMSMAVGT